MKKRIHAFFSSHAWKLSFTFRKFMLHWLSVFAVIWTFIGFVVFYVNQDGGHSWKPSVWIVLLAGILIAGWMSRPRLTRTVKLKDKDITLRITVDDMFRRKGAAAIIPTNTLFKHDHLDAGSIQVQYRDKYFSSLSAFDAQLQRQLVNEPHLVVSFNREQVKEYPIGTVIRLESSANLPRTAYLVATAELNEYGRAKPNRSQLQEGLKSLWSYIACRGRKEPLIIPIMGSGRHRINVNRYELLHDLVQSFMLSVRDNKFTEELTIVIHPESFIRNQYSLDEIEEYLRYVGKFETA